MGGKSRKDKVKSRVKTTASSVPLFIFIFLFYRSSPPQILHLHDPIVLPSIIGKIKPKMKFYFQCVRRKKEIAIVVSTTVCHIIFVFSIIHRLRNCCAT